MLAGRTKTPIPEVLCALWIVGFLALFFLQDLPNNSQADAPIFRSDVWDLAVDNLPSLLNPFDVSHATADRIDSGWHLLPQRLPFVLIACTLFVAALLVGTAATNPLLYRCDLRRAERLVMQAGVGLSLQSLWTLIAGRFGFLSTVALLIPAGLSLVVVLVRMIHTRERAKDAPSDTTSDPRTGWIAGTAIAWLFLSFVLLLLLGGMTPPFDFDVREYHVQGPKEWFQAGRISFLEHNVYTSFPFLSEMLTLDAMVLLNSWSDGAIAGKLLLAQFQLLSAICVYATTSRWFGRNAALLAAIVYITVPWTLRISIIAYAEGAISFYLIAALMTALIAGPMQDPRLRRSLVLIAGLLSGSAMAAKYPGVVSVVIPIGILLLWSHRRTSDIWRTGLLFAVGVAVAVGPWLIRNTIDTGNPVYPLMDSLFGAADWSPEMNQKWTAAHSAPERDLTRIPIHIVNATVRNDWTSGLLFAFAVPAMIWIGCCREIRWLWGMTGWILLTWWALTHRIDRFWVPVIPVAAVLAGSAWTLFDSRSWRILIVATTVTVSVYHLQLWRTSLVGFQSGLMDVDAAKQLVIRADLKILNATLPKYSRVLMVGEAEVFDCEFPLVYNTVFDESIFEQWTADESDDRRWSADRRMKSADEVKAVLHANQITHVYVNWQEIKRYRRPGSYGFTDYVMPDRFQQLVDAEVLAPPVRLSLGDWTKLSEADQEMIQSWPGSEMLQPDDHIWTSTLYYRVRP